MKPLLSLITVTFNSEKTIRDTLESIKCQQYDNYEYIVMDGGSTDGTLKIVKEYRDSFFREKMRIISERDDGIFDAMNKGIRISTGSIIGIINSDDFYEKKTLSTVCECFEQTQFDILAGDIEYIDYTGKVICAWHTGSLDKYVKKVMPLNHPAMFVRREVYSRIGVYDTKYPLAADYDFVCRAYNAQCKIVRVSDILAYMRMGGATSEFSSKNGWKRQHRVAQETRLIKIKNFQHDDKLMYLRACVFADVKFVLGKLHMLDRVTRIKRSIFGQWG